VSGTAQQQRPAQRGGPPTPNTPYILVTAFATSNKKLAVEAADELRKRIQNEHTAKELYAVPKNQIEATLTSSGYPVDSALSASDLMELSRNMHGEYVIDGKATKIGTGDAVRLETRILLRAGTTTLAQPLPPVDAKDVGDAAKIVERAIAEALKGMPNYKDCISDLRAQNYQKAEQDARLGLAAYSRSVLSRICLLQAQTAMKSPPDSIIANARAILATDSTSLLALANLVDAYKAKNDSANVVAADLQIAHLNPLNAGVVVQIIDELVTYGALDRALGLLDPMLKENPLDAPLLKKRWQMRLAAARTTPDGFKKAMLAGDSLVRADTAEATVDYFNRQIGTAQSDTNSAKVFEYASQGAVKFPKEATFQLIVAQAYMKQSKFQEGLDASRRVLEADAKNVTAGQFVLFALNQLGRVDSILPTAQRMVAGGVPADSLVTLVFAPVVGPSMTKAQASSARADWEAVLSASETVDAVLPTAQTKFYIGYAAYQVATGLMNHVQSLSTSTKAADRKLGCTETGQVEELLTKVSIAMPRGAMFNKDAAGQILTGVNSAGDFITQAKRAMCK
jgi:tetratricopeptide (TPR) repeat protein